MLLCTRDHLNRHLGDSTAAILSNFRGSQLADFSAVSYGCQEWGGKTVADGASWAVILVRQAATCQRRKCPTSCSPQASSCRWRPVARRRSVSVPFCSHPNSELTLWNDPERRRTSVSSTSTAPSTFSVRSMKRVNARGGWGGWGGLAGAAVIHAGARPLMRVRGH